MEKKLYVCRNNLACENCTDIFSMNNDALACQFFTNWVKSATEKTQENDKHFSLWCLGVYKPDSLTVNADDESAYEVCKGLDEAKNIIAAFEENA